MQAWRLVKKKYARNLSGQGAAINGGRWNHEDVAVVYVGLTPSITCLETFVHADGRPKFPLVMTELELPDDPALYWEPSLAELPEGWNSLPADVRSMDFGTQWLEAVSHLGMIVPSAIVPLDRNMVVNPQHPAASQIKIRRVTPFTLDERMARLLDQISQDK